MSKSLPPLTVPAHHSKPKTKRQVAKAMAAHGIAGRLTGAGANWEVELADEATMRRFQRLVGPTGGYKTGWGGWVLKPGYVGRGDFNDPSSRHHY